MGRHPIDHDRNRDDGQVARQYTRIERENADTVTDPKVRAMAKSERPAEITDTRLKAFLKIEREQADS
jgi:hypothetical protein